MIAAWMIEATIVALLFAAGAAAAQRVFSLYRGVPVRWFWAAAIAGTFAVSAVWFAPRPATTVNTVAVAGVVRAARSAAATPARGFHLPPISASAERGLVVGWIAASAALGLLLLFALIRLARERRGWEDSVVGGTRVSLSESLGPAAVGLLRPRVVLPRWVMGLDDAAQRAIVAHEYEHQRTRDPALLVAGLAAMVLMPWNLGVWLAWRGLRLAVEFDCDERVLARGIDRAGYAQILLGAWGQTRESWLPSAALTRSSGLGSRVQHLMRPEPRRRGMKALLGTAAAALLVIAACETPAPQSIAGPATPDVSRNVVVAETPTGPLVIVDGVRQTSGAAANSAVRIAKAAVELKQVAGNVIRVRGASPSADSKTVNGILSGLAPNQIRSIEVLKGAKATALYGPDAEHGVIIIHTKADTISMR